MVCASQTGSRDVTGSPVITDGEQRKYHNFWTYTVEGLPNAAPDGFKIPFAAGHVRRMPRLTAGPFHYKRYADRYVKAARRYTQRPLDFTEGRLAVKVDPSEETVTPPIALMLTTPRSCRVSFSSTSHTFTSPSPVNRIACAAC